MTGGGELKIDCHPGEVWKAGSPPEGSQVRRRPHGWLQVVRGWAEEGQKGAARMVTGTIGDPSQEDNPYTWRLAGQERTMGKYLKLILGRKGRPGR